MTVQERKGRDRDCARVLWRTGEIFLQKIGEKKWDVTAAENLGNLLHLREMGLARWLLLASAPTLRRDLITSSKLVANSTL